MRRLRVAPCGKRIAHKVLMTLALTHGTQLFFRHHPVKGVVDFVSIDPYLFVSPRECPQSFQGLLVGLYTHATGLMTILNAHVL